MEDKSVSEQIPIVGTPFHLVYVSDRVIGRVASYQFPVPIAGTNGVPSTLDSQTVTIQDGSGVVFTRTDSGSSISTGQTAPFAYSTGLVSGAGSTPLAINYSQDYTLTGSDLTAWLAAFGGELPTSGVPMMFPMVVGNYRPLVWGMGGWTLSSHHFYDSHLKRLYLGDGRSQKIEATTLQFPSDPNTYLAIGSENGASEIYVFQQNGRHHKTLQGLTGKALYTFSYDTNGFLSSVVDSFGNATTIARGSGGAMTGIQAPHGQVTSVTLDSNQYLATVTNPASETHEMTYSSGGLLLTFESPAGAISTMTYSPGGLLASDSNSAGYSTTLSAFSNGTMPGLPGGGTLLFSTSELSRVRQFGFQSDSAGHLGAATVEPDGTQVRTDHRANSQSIREITVNPGHTIYTSTNFMADPWLGSMADFSYGSGVSLGGLSVNRYSSKSVTAGTSPINELTTPSIFQFTDMSVTSNIAGNTWASEYVSSTQKRTVTSPIGRKVYLTTNVYGQPLEAQRATFAPVTFAYDTLGRLSEIEQGSRQSILAYGSDGYLESVTNPANQVTTFDYDAAGRVVSQTLPDSRVIGFSYDPNGNLSSVTPPGRSAHSFISTLFNAIASYLPPALGGTPTPTTFTYDNDRQLTEIERPNGTTITLNYDPTSGSLTAIDVPGGQYTFVEKGGFTSFANSPDAFQLDRLFTGNLINQEILTNSGSSTVIGTMSWTHDSNLSRASSIVTPGSGSASTISYLYDTDVLMTKAGNMTMARNSSTGFLSGTVLSRISDSYAYDSTYGEMSAYSAQYNPTSGSPTVLLSSSYTRDALGRISGKTETINGTTGSYGYTYDSAGRLTDVTRNGSAYSHYDYDSNSNRTGGNVAGVSFSAIYDAQDRIETYGSETFTQNLNGEMTGRSGGIATTYSFDVFGNIKQAVLPSKTINYKVDGLNRRVARLTGTTVNAYYVYEDQLRIAAVLNASRQITHRFIYGSKSNVPDYMVRSGTTYRIISDERGSVRLVVNASTGVVSQQIEYDEFGRVLSDSSPGFQPFGFAGCLYDIDTKLCHFGAREYDASFGRWLTKDPIIFAGGDTNLYGYVLNDPINSVDPSGLKISDKTGGRIPAEVRNSAMYKILDGRSETITIRGNESMPYYGLTTRVGSDSQLISINFGMNLDPNELMDTLIHELGHAEANLLFNFRTSSSFDHASFVPSAIERNVNVCK